MKGYTSCELCPRRCRIDRQRGETGFCGQTSVIRLAAAVIHFGEEPPVTGKGGSGTVFFTGCTLQCSFCQNRQISTGNVGKEISSDELVRVFLRLQEEAAENINLVTGTHFIPGIAAALARAEHEGLTIPVVWNSSGFESVEALKIIDPHIDIYLPDLKTLSPEVSMQVYGRADYAERAKEAVLLMMNRRPLRMEEKRLVSGVIVRHLVLPGMGEVTGRVLRWYADNCIDRENQQPSALLSLMVQFTPVRGELGGEEHGPVENRRVSAEEYEEVCAYLERYGIEEGFIQELEDGESWYPDFRNRNPFPDPQARTVWHWRDGYSPSFASQLSI